MKFNKLIELTVIRKTLVAILLLACTVLFLLVLKKDAEYVEPVGSYGKPALVIEEKPLRKFSIDQVADDSQCIYLLDESNGVLLVFDVHGTYKYTVFFYDTLNGAFRMAIIQDVLYVQDSQDNIYVFRFGELERFIKVSEQTDDVTINFEQTSSNYELRWNGVYKSKRQN